MRARPKAEGEGDGLLPERRAEIVSRFDSLVCSNVDDRSETGGKVGDFLCIITPALLPLKSWFKVRATR